MRTERYDRQRQVRKRERVYTITVRIRKRGEKVE